MMMLQEAPCAVYTVKKINGPRDLKRRMENMGIAAGADVEVIKPLNGKWNYPLKRPPASASVNSLNGTETLFCSAVVPTDVQETSGIGQMKLTKIYKEMKDNEATCGKTRDS